MKQPFRSPISSMLINSKKTTITNILQQGQRQTHQQQMQIQKRMKSSFMEADTGAIGTKFYHYTSTFLMVAFPLAFVPVKMISFPFELSLGLIIPLHSHIGFNYIISDYVPKAMRSSARGGVLATTLISVAGLTYINLTQGGIADAFLSLWKKPSKEDKN